MREISSPHDGPRHLGSHDARPCPNLPVAFETEIGDDGYVASTPQSWLEGSKKT